MVETVIFICVLLWVDFCIDPLAQSSKCLAVWHDKCLLILLFVCVSWCRCYIPWLVVPSPCSWWSLVSCLPNYWPWPSTLLVRSTSNKRGLLQRVFLSMSALQCLLVQPKLPSEATLGDQGCHTSCFLRLLFQGAFWKSCCNSNLGKKTFSESKKALKYAYACLAQKNQPTLQNNLAKAGPFPQNYLIFQGYSALARGIPRLFFYLAR